MAKKQRSPEYIEATDLSHKLKCISADVAIIDRMLADIQIAKAEAEEKGEKTSPLWKELFHIKQRIISKSLFAESNRYSYVGSISLTETELIMIRGFKQEQINQINKQILDLSERISAE